MQMLERPRPIVGSKSNRIKGKNNEAC